MSRLKWFWILTEFIPRFVTVHGSEAVSPATTSTDSGLVSKIGGGESSPNGCGGCPYISDITEMLKNKQLS